MLSPLSAFAKLAPKPGLREWRGVRFTEFCRAIGVTLEPGQEALARVAYDGDEPRDLPPELRAIARELFGPLDVIPPEARRVVVIVAGARSGKSYVLAALRILHLALTVSLDSLAPGEEAYGVIVAPDPRQRQQCYRYVLGAVRETILAPLLVGDPGAHLFRLRRRDGREVAIESVPAGRGGRAGRGRALVGAALEECAFFLDSNYVVNDDEVFRALKPRVLPEGQTILSSTPWAEMGLLYREFVACHPEPWRAAPHLQTPGTSTRALAAHAPTLLLRDVEDTRANVAAEQERDPYNAAREYGAQFLAIGATQFFDAAAVAEAIDPTLELGAAPEDREDHVVVEGIDLGFKRDAAAGVTVERTPEQYRLLGYLELMPGPERLKPSQVFAALGSHAAASGARELVGDQHYAASAEEAFYGRGLIWIETPAGAQGKAQVYMAADHVFRERLIRLPNDPRLLQQLREVRKRPLPGGGISIEQPRRAANAATGAGGHGDVVSALVHAIWRASLLRIPPAAVKPPEDPREAAAEQWGRRTEERIEQRRRRDARDEGQWDGRWTLDESDLQP